MKRGWMYLLALVLGASAVPLLQVLLDRSGPPRATFQVTQREFYHSSAREESTGEALSWSWGTPPEIDSIPGERVRAFGLRCHRTPADCDLGDARPGWMVVTLDTVLWRRRVDSAQASLDSLDALAVKDSQTLRDRAGLVSRLEQARDHESRLVLVDVGPDLEPLAAKWADPGHFILPARITAYRQYPVLDTLHPKPMLYRVHAEPLSPMLYVPNEWAGLVRDTTVDQRVRYQVTVALGRRWLPRVLEVTR